MLEQSKIYEQWLCELTGMPTAPGRESRVVEYIHQWVKTRRSLMIEEDSAGNLVVRRRRKARTNFSPIYLQAHIDHPAFVVIHALDKRTILAEFRGGVHDEFFKGAPVILHTGDQKTTCRGYIIDFESSVLSDKPMDLSQSKKIFRIKFAKNVVAQKGDILTWDTGKVRVVKRLLRAPACDDLSAVAAALCVFDQWIKASSSRNITADVRLLFTRAEEVGFIGTIAACKLGTVPDNARIICLENSKSFPESPLGGGPIIRVGDRISTFSPDLAYRFHAIAQAMLQQNPAFKYQRKLMPGGTCEASVYQAWGYQTTCLCLPLANYHNMNETTRKIDAEMIHLDDFHGLRILLASIIKRLDDPQYTPSLLSKIEALYTERSSILKES